MPNNKYLVEVKVMLLRGLVDPQGKTVKTALHRLSYRQVEDVRVGKHVYLLINASTEEEAKSLAKEIAKRVLANPVVEEWEITSIRRV